jgi:hypothetical protein
MWGVKCGAGELVDGLGHKLSQSRLMLRLGNASSSVCSLVYFPAALTPIRACGRSRSSNLINAIFVEEERGRGPI